MALTGKTPPLASSLSVIDTILSVDLINTGTVTLSYPNGKDRSNFLLGARHVAVANTGDVYEYPKDFGIAFNSGSMVVTWRTATLVATTRVRWQFDEPGDLWRDVRSGNLSGAPMAQVMLISLGAAKTLDADGVCAAANRTGAGAMSVAGALASGGTATLDTARNLIAVSGGADTAVITVSGEDIYAQGMKETFTLNGATPVPGRKAWKKILSVTSSATVTNGLDLGTGDVLGLPMFLPSTGLVMRELENGATASAGTVVSGGTVAPGAATADVRGTYDPASTADGSKVFHLLIAVPDPGYIGPPQLHS